MNNNQQTEDAIRLQPSHDETDNGKDTFATIPNNKPSFALTMATMMVLLPLLLNGQMTVKKTTITPPPTQPAQRNPVRPPATDYKKIMDAERQRLEEQRKQFEEQLKQDEAEEKRRIVDPTTDQTALAEIVKNQRLKIQTRIAAIEKMTDRSTLWEIAYNLNIDRDVRQAATKRFEDIYIAWIEESTDQSALAEIAENALSMNVRQAAKQRLTSLIIDDSVHYFNTTYIHLQLYMSHYHLYIDANGIVWRKGMMGPGSHQNTSWEKPIKHLENVRSIYVIHNSAISHSTDKSYFFIKTNNELWAMGNNANGQLGDDTGIDRSSPVLVMEDVANLFFDDNPFQWNKVFAQKIDKSLWHWGGGVYTPKEFNDNQKSNQLNQELLESHISMRNGNPERYTSARVFGEFMELLGGKDNTTTSIAIGNRTYAITKDGVLWGWGGNGGSLGDGTRATREKPVKIAENAKRLLEDYFITQSNDWYRYSDGQTFRPLIAFQNVLYVCNGTTWFTRDEKLYRRLYNDSPLETINDIKLPSIVRASDGKIIAPKF